MAIFDEKINYSADLSLIKKIAGAFGPIFNLIVAKDQYIQKPDPSEHDPYDEYLSPVTTLVIKALKAALQHKDKMPEIVEIIKPLFKSFITAGQFLSGKRLDLMHKAFFLFFAKTQTKMVISDDDQEGNEFIDNASPQHPNDHEDDSSSSDDEESKEESAFAP